MLKTETFNTNSIICCNFAAYEHKDIQKTTQRQFQLPTTN